MPTNYQHTLKALPSEQKDILRNGIKSGVANDEFKQVFQSLPKGLQDELKKEIALRYKKEKQGVLSQTAEFAGDVASSVIEGYEKYITAPTRSAISSTIKGENPISAGYKQFGRDPRKAPSGEDISEQLGFPREPSPDNPLKVEYGPSGQPIEFRSTPLAKDVGLFVDVGADPTNVIPVGALAKLGAKWGIKAGALAGKKVGGWTGKQALKFTKEVTPEVGDTIEAILKTFNPKQAGDLPDMLRIAKQNNIPTETLAPSIEFGKDSFITKGKMAQVEGTTGSKIEKAWNEQRDIVADRVKEKVANFSGGKVLDEEQAGDLLREAYEKGMNEMFSSIELSYDTVSKKFPNLRLSEAVDPEAYSDFQKALDKLEVKQSKMLESADRARRVQAKNLLEDIQYLRDIDDYDVFLDRIRDIGEVAYSKPIMVGDKVPPNVKDLAKIYDEGRGILLEAAKNTLGEDEALKLVLQNRAVSDFLQNAKPLAKILGNPDKKSKDIFRSLIKNIDKETKDRLMTVLPDGTLEQVRATFLEGLLRENIEGNVPYRTVYNLMRNKITQLKHLFSPSEIEGFKELLTYGDRLGVPYFNSNTTRGLSFNDIPNNLKTALFNDVVLRRLEKMARKQPLDPIPERITPFTRALRKGEEIGRKGLIDIGEAAKQRRGVTGNLLKAGQIKQTQEEQGRR